jgi:hypothetical protein
MHGDLFRSLIAVMVAGLVSGCEAGPRQTLLEESSKGTVFLERVPDRSFQAAHPLKIGLEAAARVLRGVYVKGPGDATPVPLLSDEEIDFVAPRLAGAMLQASSNQRVGFRLPDGRGATLYAYGRSLHLTVITAGSEQEILFFPEAARRPDSYRETGLLGEEPRLSVVVNYELLAKLPASMLAPMAEGQQADQLAAPGGATPRAKSVGHGELEALKAELRVLRERIARQEAEIQALKDGKQKPTGKK